MESSDDEGMDVGSFCSLMDECDDALADSSMPIFEPEPKEEARDVDRGEGGDVEPDVTEEVLLQAMAPDFEVRMSEALIF